MNFKDAIVRFVEIFDPIDIDKEHKALSGETYHARVANGVYSQDDYETGNDFYMHGIYFENGGSYVVARNELDGQLYRGEISQDADDNITVSELVPVVEVQHVPKSNVKIGKTNFTSFKNANGEWMFAGIFTNAFRDQDGYPELLTSDAHKNFESMVLAGEAPYPAFKVYHLNVGKATGEAGLAIGQSDWLAFDDETKMFFVAGHYYPAFYYVAEALASSDKAMGMSHGFEVLERDGDDHSNITAYRTVEVSALLRTDAANILTGYETRAKEYSMSISQEQRDSLVELLGSQDAADRLIDGSGKQFKAVADLLELETKETTEEVTEESTEDVEETEEVEVAYATEADVAGLVTELRDAVVNIQGTISELTKQVAALQKTDEVKQAEALKATPTTSRLSLLKTSLFTDESKVDGRTSIAKQSPKEQTTTSGHMLAGLIGGNK